MFTSKSPLGRGIYRHTPTCQVPASVLLDIYNIEPEYTELYTYLHTHLSEIVSRFDDEKEKDPPDPPVLDEDDIRVSMHTVRLLCAVTGKIRYFKRRDARDHLRAIRDRHTGEHKIPHRAYRCEFCDDWHLTSGAHWKWAG